MDRVGVLVVSKCLSAPGIIETFSRSGYKPEFYVVERQANPLSVSKARVHSIVPDLNVADVARFARRHRAKLSFGLTDTEDFIIAGGRDIVELESGVPMLCVTSKYAVEKSKADQRTLFQELFRDANPGYAIIDPAKHGSESSAVREFKRFAAELKRPVIKPDAPARGAGVGVWGQEFSNEDEMVSFFRSVYSKGKVVVEEKIDGEESSFQAFSDGSHFIVAPQTRDYKRALDANEGRLTGGMGSYRSSESNLPFIRPSEWDSLVLQEKEAFRRWKGRGSNPELKGFVLYDALMHGKRGFKILERNSRGGNTEQLCLFTTLQDDPVDVYFRMSEGLLKGIRFSNRASVVTCAVPLSYGIEGAAPRGEEKVDFSGAYALQRRIEGLRVYPMDVTLRNDAAYLGTSRSAAVIGVGATLEEARQTSLEGVDALKGPVRSRRDIASKSDISKSAAHMRELRRTKTSA
jgi:phosphoribosylamine---glycine ligase